MTVRSALALVLFATSGAAWAGDKPLYQPAPGWIVPAPEPDYAKIGNSDPMLVVFDQQQRIENGQVWAYLDQVLRVATPEALNQAGQIQLPWQPDGGDLIVHRAEIIRGTQHIDLIAAGQRFQVLQREEQLEQRQLSGTLTATMQIEGLRVGDMVRLTVSRTNRDKALGGNVQASMPLLAEPVRARFGRARLSWPTATPIRWRSDAEATPKVQQRGGFDEIEVPLPLAKAAEMPGDAPVRYQRLGLLESSSFADWPAVSKVMAPLYGTKGLIAPGSPLAGEVAKIAAKTSDPRERAALALQLVQDEVRYFFVGMNGGNYVPQSPARTWELRYGDCKAKTLLLLALLHALDVQAEPVAASIALGDLAPKRLPSPGAFDHVLVRAEIGGKSLWLDGTGSGSRLQDLDDTPPFRNVLPLRAAGSALVPIATHAPARPLAEVAVDYDQSAGLMMPTPFRIEFRMRGQPGEMMRAFSTQATKEQTLEMAQQMVRSTLGDASITDRSIRYDPGSASAIITVSGILTTPWHKENERYRMRLDKTVEPLDFAPDRARAAWKDIPVAIGAPALAVTRIRVRLPDGGKGFELEGDRSLPAVLGQIRPVRTAAIQGEWVDVHDVIGVDGGEIAPAAIGPARAQVALAKTRLLEAVAPADYPSRWQQVRAARQADRLKPILAAYAKAIEEDPKAALGYSNRAAFHSGTWDWKSAVADYGKALAIEPSVDLYLARSNAYVALGDTAKALGDAKAALDLDPGSTAATSSVARLRFRSGERDAALAMVRERIAQGGKEKLGFVQLQAELMGEAGRGEEGLAALDEAIRTNPGNADLLNERCWLKGTLKLALDTALKDCTRAIEIAEQPANIYDSRAMVYYRLGRTDEALADLDAALNVAPDMGASLFLRGVLRRQKGDGGADADLMGARLIWPQVDADYARYGIRP